MLNEQRKRKCDDLALRVIEINRELHDLAQELEGLDRRAAAYIMTDLTWAAENLTVIGLHQINEALTDTMGIG